MMSVMPWCHIGDNELLRLIQASLPLAGISFGLTSPGASDCG